MESSGVFWRTEKLLWIIRNNFLSPFRIYNWISPQSAGHLRSQHRLLHWRLHEGVTEFISEPSLTADQADDIVPLKLMRLISVSTNLRCCCSGWTQFFLWQLFLILVVFFFSLGVNIHSDCSASNYSLWDKTIINSSRLQHFFKLRLIECVVFYYLFISKMICKNCN